jgi:hypothetical protein
MLRKLYERFFGQPGAALVSDRPVYFTDIWGDEYEWYFSWRSQDGKTGEVRGPYLLKDMALAAKDRWTQTRKQVSRCLIARA